MVMAQASAGAVHAHALGSSRAHQRCRHRLGRHREAPPSRRVRTHRARTTSSAEASSSVAADDAAVERDTRAWLDTMVIGMNLCPFARAALPGTKIVVASDVTDARSLREAIARELAILAAAPTTPPVTTLVVLPPAVTDRLGATTHEGFMEGAYRCAEDATRELTAAMVDDDDDDDGAGREDGDVIDIVPFHPLATFGGDVSEEDEEESRGYICTYLDVPDEDDEDHEEEEAKGGGGDGVTRSPPTTEELRRMIEAHETFAGGADRRADWRATSAAASDAEAGTTAGARDRHPPAPVDPADFTGRSPHPVLHLLRRCDVAAADDAWYGERGPGTDIRAANAAALRAKGERDLARMLRRCVGVAPAPREPPSR